MDFLSFIRDQSEHLQSQDYVKILWGEIENNQINGDIPTQILEQYNNHLPVLLDQFVEFALQKLDNEQQLDEVDNELKQYLLVLIYHCLKNTNETISNSCIDNVCEIYLTILTTNLHEEFYNEHLYSNVLAVLQRNLESTDRNYCKFVGKLRKFLIKSKLSSNNLQLTCSTLVYIIFTRTTNIIDDYNLDITTKSVSHQALLSLKALIINETITTNKMVIITFMFNGLCHCDSIHLTPTTLNLIQTNFVNLLKNLHETFEKDQYRTFLNAFIHVWKLSSFIYFKEAVIIMNNLKEKYYKILLDILNKMINSTSTHRNLFYLSMEIVRNPTKIRNLDKIKVTNEILIRNILLNCLSTTPEISNTAIRVLCELLTSPDLHKDYIETPVKNIINNQNPTLPNTTTILNGLKSLIKRKWTNKSPNKPLFGIILTIILLSDEDYTDLYGEILDLLSEEMTPYEIKSFLLRLFDLYLDLSERNFQKTSLQILKIIFKMALHPMASSNDFVKHLYTSMVFPPIFKERRINRDIFIDPIIANSFNFKEFYQKCHTLGLIKKEHVFKLLGDISTTPETNLKLICAIISLTDYNNLSIIADYVNDNFTNLCTNPNLHYYLDIYSKILQKNSTNSTNLQQTLRDNEIMVYFIKHHLLQQNFDCNSVVQAFSLLKSLGNVTNLNEDFQRLKTEYDIKLGIVLEQKLDYVPVYYYSQFVLFGHQIPNDNNLTTIKNFLETCKRNEQLLRSPEFNPKFWIACLLLFTNLSIIKQQYIDITLNYLQHALNSSITSVKLATINMYFDLCNMVTHNFEDLTRFIFKQLLSNDDEFKRTCLMKIDRLIRDDYLKLNLVEFIVFVSILGDRQNGLSDYLNQLLNQHFYISSSSVIAKYFVPLLVHLNGYQKHAIFKLSSSELNSVEIVANRVSDRRKIYTILFTGLPTKLQFNIVNNIAINIIDKVVDNEIKLADGFWAMLKDAIFVFKLMTNNNETSEEFYKEVVNKIDKYLLRRGEYSETSRFQEYQKEILLTTKKLQDLLFFNDSENVQKHIRIPLFDAIMHWTDYLISDLFHIIHKKGHVELQEVYEKTCMFYQKNAHSLKPNENI